MNPFLCGHSSVCKSLAKVAELEGMAGRYEYIVACEKSKASYNNNK